MVQHGFLMRALILTQTATFLLCSHMVIFQWLYTEQERQIDVSLSLPLPSLPPSLPPPSLPPPPFKAFNPIGLGSLLTT